MKKSFTWLILFLLLIPGLIQPKRLQTNGTWVLAHASLLLHIATFDSQKLEHPRVTGLGVEHSQEPLNKQKMTNAFSSVVPPLVLFFRGLIHSTQMQVHDTLHLGAGSRQMSTGRFVNLNNSALHTHFKVLTQITSKERLLSKRRKRKRKVSKANEKSQIDGLMSLSLPR